VRQDGVVLALLAAVAAMAAVAPAAPAPEAPLPTEVAPVAHRLVVATRALDVAVDAWRRTGSARPPRELHLWALHQQRLYLALGLARASFGAAVVARLPRDLQADAADVLRARRALVRLTPPTTLPLSSFRTGPPEPAGALLRHYRDAERRFGVPWHVLAAVNFVETAFGKMRSRSTAGAQGPMQFMPATWRAYGLGGDVHDPRDAIMGAANYLRASGARTDLRHALWAYNHSTLYVDAVLAYARVMRRDVGAFYGFHAWQVFVRTAAGYRRLTTP
jgi:soluble lytic murein transglycosylase-like protein